MLVIENSECLNEILDLRNCIVSEIWRAAAVNSRSRLNRRQNKKEILAFPAKLALSFSKTVAVDVFLSLIAKVRFYAPVPKLTRAVRHS